MKFPQDKCLICGDPMTYDARAIWCTHDGPNSDQSHYRFVLIKGHIHMIVSYHGDYALYHFLEEGMTNVWKNGDHICVIPTPEIDYSNAQLVLNKLKLITVFS